MHYILYFMGGNNRVAIDSNQFIGKTLGTCTLQYLLGRGGMGSVYVAQQSRPRRTVAVKVLMPDFLQKSTQYNEFLARFRREADAIAALDHVNIMPIYEYGEQEHIAYLVMPHVTGGTLRDMLLKRRTLPLNVVLPIVEQIAAALDYAHKHGIVHRDLKPANMLFHADGRLLLTDFGIAKVINDPTLANPANPQALQTLTTTGTIIGTPEYLSPEQATGNQVDQRTDVYSLGIVVYQMLCGDVPFVGATPVATAIKHAMEDPPSLIRMNPEISPSVEEVILKAIAKRPEQRYATAGEFAQALRRATNNGVSSPTPNAIQTESDKGEKEHPIAFVSLQTVAELPPTTPPNQDRMGSDTPPPPVEFASAPTVSMEQPRPQKRRNRRPPVLAIISVLIVLVLLLGGVLLYSHQLPGSQQGGNSLTSNQATSTATHAPAQTPSVAVSPTTAPNSQQTLPKPSIAAGTLLFGSVLPSCDNQRSLWSTRGSPQVTCESADALIQNKGSQPFAGIFLNTLANNQAIPGDYVLEIQAKEGSAAGTFGIFFRTQTGAGHQGGFSFLIQPSGYWNGYAYDDTTGQQTLLFGRQGDALTTNGFTTIDILIRGTSFMIYYKGVNQGGIAANTFSNGIIGLAVATGAEVQFRDFAIYNVP